MKLAPLADMWTQYPTDSKSAVATLVGGTCGDNITKYDWDTCCIRLSHALNYSARPVEGFSGIANPGLGPTAKVRASKGGDNKWYIYSCYDMRAYLEVRFGLPKTFHHAFEDVDLSGLKGIILFGMRHSDLWDGSQVRYNTDFTDGTKTVSEIRIWKTPEPASE
jgi:hypothetical protein